MMDVLGRALAVGALTVLASSAAAHPFATRVVAHQTQVEVTVEGIEVDYYVEVPVRASPEGKLDIEAFDRLETGIALEIDGEWVPLQRDPAHPPRVRGTSHTVGMRLWLRAESPLGPEHDLRITNTNYPDLPGYFSTAFKVGPQVDVLESSLLEIREGALARDHNGRWGAGDPFRTADLRVRFRRDPLHVAFHRLQGTRRLIRPSAAALPLTPIPAWLMGAITFQVLGFLLALAIAAGVALGSALAVTEAKAAQVSVRMLAAAILACGTLWVLPPAATLWTDLVMGTAAAGLG
ncbi:MAG: hypothetical protein JRI25_00985, partial [Deltaproteobacteria bacterium]|nr:hypothetical protein [Deltaproteobacteria bacterium]